jgi:hypothetical protein
MSEVLAVGSNEVDILIKARFEIHLDNCKSDERKAEEAI